MYHEYYGLRESPFELTPDPRYLYLTPKHREALSVLEYALSSAKGLTVLTGEAGTGKTTLVRTTARRRQPNTHCACLTNPTLTRDEFLEWFASALAISDDGRLSKPSLLARAEDVLVRRHANNERTVLIIDEAQSLSHELLEEVRLLANIESDTAKLLSVVLVGQPELGARLNEARLRQLKQRIVLRAELIPLNLEETASYIATRIRQAGGECGRLFTREAVTVIHEHSRGIPRTISVICENALLTGFAADCRPVTSALIREVCRDFDLRTAESPAARLDLDSVTPGEPFADGVAVQGERDHETEAVEQPRRPGQSGEAAPAFSRFQHFKEI